MLAKIWNDVKEKSARLAEEAKQSAKKVANDIDSKHDKYKSLFMMVQGY